MAIPQYAQKQVTICFNSVTSISKFKHECGCSDFYIDRDQLTMVGYFTEDQIRLAMSKYAASLNSGKGF